VKNKTDQIVGFVLGLIVIVICYYWFFEKTPDAPPQTDGTFSSMPAADRSGVAGIDEFRLCELQMSAVIIDMHRYLGWFPDEKEAMRTASIKAVSDLLSIKTFLNDCRFKRPHRTVAEQTLTAIDKLILLYDGIEKKDDEMLKIQFAEYFADRRSFQTDYEDDMDHDDPVFGDSDRSLPPQLALVGDPADRDAYVKSLQLLRTKQYSPACELLVDLRSEYKNTPFEQILMLRLSDCLLMSEPAAENGSVFDPEKGIETLEEVLDAGMYSPVLYEAFRKWRTQTQVFWNGLSNMSVIPNWDYNLKRWKVLRTLRDRLSDESEDRWAAEQADLLLTLPNIHRGGYFGNDVLFEQHVLEPEESKR
jgi:hypothetical protein